MKLSRLMSNVVCVVVSLSLAGCAAMFNGASQVVSIRSNMDDAKLYVNEEYIGKGNGVSTFKKKKKYEIVARKEGCEETKIIPSKSFDATTLLGILIDWGIVSILIVDGIATGAWQQFDQTNFVVDPRCSQAVDASVNTDKGDNKTAVETNVETQPVP